jgi:DNA-directed RNA polymerase specialized sigma24 family protein
VSELTLEAAMAGLLRLAVVDREERIATDPNAKKIEVLLDEAGLTHGQIAEVTGKKADAVRMAISRATAATATKPAKAKTARASTPAIPRSKK